MERLTKRNAFGEVTVSGKDDNDINRKYREIANRLAELEDKLESGQLVEFPRVRLLAEEGDDKLFSVEWLDKESGDIRSCFCLSEKILKQTLKELQSK